MVRITELLMRQNVRSQRKHVKKLTGYSKNFFNTRVASEQYLRSSVKERKSKISSGGMCLGDMQVLLDCMKMNEFQEKSCVQEFAKYNDCLAREKKYLDELRATTSSERLGEEERLNTKQVNKLLSMFPNPGPRFYFTSSNKHKLNKPVVIQYTYGEAWALPENVGKKKM